MSEQQDLCPSFHGGPGVARNAVYYCVREIGHAGNRRDILGRERENRGAREADRD